MVAKNAHHHNKMILLEWFLYGHLDLLFTVEKAYKNIESFNKQGCSSSWFLEDSQLAHNFFKSLNIQMIF